MWNSKIILYFILSWNQLIWPFDLSKINGLTSKTIILKVLLVEFKDVKHRNPNYPPNLSLPAYTFDDFNNLFFSQDKYISPNMNSPDGKKVFGSLRDYFRIMSNEKLIIEGNVVNYDKDNDNIPDWIVLDSNKGYYHNNNGDKFRAESKYKAALLGLDVNTDENNFLAIIYAGHTYRHWGNTLNPAASCRNREYIMGERFVSNAPYNEERDDPSINPISHFSHIGIHAHEFAHLLGLYDLLNDSYNNDYCLMSSGNYNGPRNEGACPAPINPYFREKLHWINCNSVDDSISKILSYNLNNPEVYELKYNCPQNSVIIEYRKFNCLMNLNGQTVEDYNSYIKNINLNDGFLIWRIFPIGFIKLMNSCGDECSGGDHNIFPGKKNINVITPWSDNRENKYNYYWIPNTTPSNNCGIEFKSKNNKWIVDLYQKNPELTSSSKPRNIELDSSSNSIKLIWDKNYEPDFDMYKIYKKTENLDYFLYDSTSFPVFTDHGENVAKNNDSFSYAFYKLICLDSDKKESAFSEEVKVRVKSKKITNTFEKLQSYNDSNLFQNYPNPFNKSTNIQFTIVRSSPVTIEVYDLLGRKLTTLLDEYKLPGKYQIQFVDKTNIAEAASGIYLFCIETEYFRKTIKAIVLK